MKFFKPISLIILLFLSYTVSSLAQKKPADEAYDKFNDILNTDTGLDQRSDDLKHLLKIVRTDTTRLHILEEITVANTYSYPDSGLVYAQHALQLAQKLNVPGELYNCYYGLAEVFRILGEYSKAIDFFLKAYPIAQNFKNNKLDICWLDATLGICYTNYGDYEKSHTVLLKALAYFNKSMNGNDSGVYESVCTYAAEMYGKRLQMDSALYYGNLAFKIDSIRKDSWSWVKIVLGNIYAKRNDNAKALVYYKSALKRCERKDSIDIYNGLANIFQSSGKKDSAIFYAKTALFIAGSSSYLSEMLAASQALTDGYNDINKDSTLKYLRLTIGLKDSLFSQAKAREIQGFYFNDQLRQQELKTTEASYKNKIRIYILFATILIILVFAIILLRNNQHKQKANLVLQNEKKKVESTLSELKFTQSQLIQSEKMASLGELTAGIAHEIQNPLNFVNNFSEVNTELIQELKSQKLKVKSDRDEELEIELINDIADNEEKINHHGKRADAIVKGMLQHSRASTGKKDSADINTLADEYLRLSYHGFRAKDKSFNAVIETHFDESIGKIEVIPQDIGRVLLNLFNNAFYTVNEKKKQSGEVFEPVVSVSTKKENDKIEIRVLDNGTGIPQKIVDKIFQPFFTTKPTGEGTGLGLSLSYDIIKAHGGELKVKTKEGEGSEFIIELPTK